MRLVENVSKEVGHLLDSKQIVQLPENSWPSTIRIGKINLIYRSTALRFFVKITESSLFLNLFGNRCLKSTYNARRGAGF